MMKRKRHSEEQTIAIPKEHETAVKTADLGRKHGTSQANFYNWEVNCDGIKVSEAERLKGRRWRMPGGTRVVEAMLDNAALKDLLAKRVTPAAKRDAAALAFCNMCERQHAGRSLLAGEGAVSSPLAGRCRTAIAPAASLSARAETLPTAPAPLRRSRHRQSRRLTLVPAG